MILYDKERLCRQQFNYLQRYMIKKLPSINDNNLEVYVTQGATIKAEEGTGRILIARVMHGGAADRSGLISCGDEVIEVNGINVEGKTPNDVLKILVIV